METVEYKNISFTVWDVGGQDKVCIPFFQYVYERSETDSAFGYI